jgi:Ferredoxin
MRVTVDPYRCQGHTLCAMSAPDVFELTNDDGHAIVPDPDVPDGLRAAVRAAASTCPEQAIVVEQ